MERLKTDIWWLIRRLVYLLVASLLFVCLLSAVLARALPEANDGPAWSTPQKMATKRISPVNPAQHEPNFLNNLDCTLVDYRAPSSSSMQSGCFTPTAFGLLDSDTDTAIFNGTDEGLPLLPFFPGQVLAPWPEALNLVSLNAAVTGGSYISLYKNPLTHLQDQRDTLLRLTAKQLTAGPDLPLKGSDGQPLIVNPQTIAFSDGGSWLVAETLGGSFLRINLATLDVLAFAPAYGSQGSPALLKSRVAISSNGRYVAIANDEAQAFKVYDLNVCTANCPAHDYLPFVKQQISSFQSLRHLRFVNDGLLSFEVRTFSSDQSGVYELAPTESIDHLIDYLGLGDSYTSGEGAFDYLAGTDTSDNFCHLSVQSYPLLLSKDLFSHLGGHSVACSGAVIHDVGTRAKDYRGQITNGLTFERLQTQPALLNAIMTNYLPGYVAQQRFVGQYQPAIITVSIGGNDVGFGDILEQCVVPHISRHFSDSTCFNTYEDRQEVIELVDRTVRRWTTLYNQLLEKSPGVRLYAIGYPDIIDDQGQCSLNTLLNKSELEFAKELVIYINDAIKRAADKSGIVYVDIGQALVGHRLCEADSSAVAVNGLTAGRDFGPLGRESYHPNALGHQLVEQTILRQTHNLTDVFQPKTDTNNKAKLLAVPKTGRATAKRTPAKITSKVVKAGKTTKLKISGASRGLKPKAPLKVTLDGPAGRPIGDITPDENGDIDGDVMIPIDTPPGGHTIDIGGDDQAGEPIYVTQPIYIPISDNDSDGDDLPDMLDTCPYAINSGQDIDHDGTDDICDPLIGQTASTQPGTIQNQGKPASHQATLKGSTSVKNPSVPHAPAPTELRNNGWLNFWLKPKVKAHLKYWLLAILAWLLLILLLIIWLLQDRQAAKNGYKSARVSATIEA